jgi:NTE family protein
MKKKKQKTLAIALGGGAALGFAHIGFIQILEENDIKIHAVAGTSMGAIIGAFYAYGYSGKQLEKLSLEKVHLRQFFTDLNPITFIKKGFVSGKKIQTVFNGLLDQKNIQDLKIPYACVAVDMFKGEPVIFKKGLVCEAVRASISIPGVFTPVKKDDMLLVDGGIVNNVPVDVAKDFDKDIVIGVDVLGEYKLENEPKTITGMVVASFHLMQQEYNKYKPDHSDLMIKLNLDNVNVTSFSKDSIKEAIKMGRKYAKQNLEQIKKLLY